jgi:hypothetical protein
MGNWQQGKDDPTEWLARRAAFSGGGIVKYDRSRGVLSDEQTKRDTVVEAMMNCRSLGSGDTPSGRRKSYNEVVFPFDSNPGQANDPSVNSSSCGTFIRGIWQLLGAGAPRSPTQDRQFRADYKPSKTQGVLNFIGQYAKDFGGCVGDPDSGSGFLPPSNITKMKKGDCVYFAVDGTNNQHIFTLASDMGAPYARDQLTGAECYSIDVIQGGQTVTDEDARNHVNTEDASCHRILVSNYTLFTNATQIYYKSDHGTYTARYWASLAAVPFVDAPIIPLDPSP